MGVERVWGPRNVGRVVNPGRGGKDSGIGVQRIWGPRLGRVVNPGKGVTTGTFDLYRQELVFCPSPKGVLEGRGV